MADRGGACRARGACPLSAIGHRQEAATKSASRRQARGRSCRPPWSDSNPEDFASMPVRASHLRVRSRTLAVDVGWGRRTATTSSLVTPLFSRFEVSGPATACFRRPRWCTRSPRALDRRGSDRAASSSPSRSSSSEVRRRSSSTDLTSRVSVSGAPACAGSSAWAPGVDDTQRPERHAVSARDERCCRRTVRRSGRPARPRCRSRGARSGTSSRRGCRPRPGCRMSPHRVAEHC